MVARLDEIDYKILEILRENGRAPYTEIAKAVGLSEAAVRKRVNSMVKRGIIRKFSIEYSVEGEVRALVLVKTAPPARTPEIAEKIRGVDGVEAVYEVTGEYDIAALVRGMGISYINRCIDSIRSIQGVVATYTMIILRVHV
ncbi:MAG: HTH-type transcriptional regulator LysM [Desulfurococcales archaeon]|nr:HTH-type transcriptional regulator LysM [Desulfurococcales archaeon]